MDFFFGLYWNRNIQLTTLPFLLGTFHSKYSTVKYFNLSCVNVMDRCHNLIFCESFSCFHLIGILCDRGKLCSKRYQSLLALPRVVTIGNAAIAMPIVPSGVGGDGTEQ